MRSRRDDLFAEFASFLGLDAGQAWSQLSDASSEFVDRCAFAADLALEQVGLGDDAFAVFLVLRGREQALQVRLALVRL